MSTRGRFHHAAWWLPVLLVVVVLSILTHVVPAFAQRIDFLYIEANSGGSSGGHDAVCFARDCFHFQQTPGRLLRIARQAADHLDYAYRIQQNRPIHALQLNVDAAATVRLQRRLEEYERAQTRQIEQAAALRDELAFLDGLQQGAVSGTASAVVGAGYFFDEAVVPNDGAPSLEVASVAARLAARFGADILDRRAAELSAEIETLDVASVAPQQPKLGETPTSWIGAAGRYQELLSSWLAVQVLRETRAPLVRYLHAVTGEDGRIDAAQRRMLRVYAAQIEESLVHLFASRRPDWGYPMLVGLARLHAVHRSIESGRLVLLDVYSQQAEKLPARFIRRHRRSLHDVAANLQSQFASARARFFDAKEPGEAAWSGMELHGNRWLELERSLALGGPLRLHEGVPLPIKEAKRSEWPLPRPSAVMLEQAMRTTRLRADQIDASLYDLYAYDLLRRNCATELLAWMDAEQLTVSPGLASQTFAFIPFVSWAHVRGAFDSAELQRRPSHRQTEIERLSADTSPLLLRLRESNTLTSQIYEPHEDDSAFLFFTDDALALRPLLGAANLAFAGIVSAAGLLALPLAGDHLLFEGLNGMLFSLPELAFANIRKGTFPFAPPPHDSSGRDHPAPG